MLLRNIRFRFETSVAGPIIGPVTEEYFISGSAGGAGNALICHRHDEEDDDD